jgi:hypothetical protein
VQGKKRLQDKKTGQSNQEVNAITPFPDNFYYEVSSSPSIPMPLLSNEIRTEILLAFQHKDMEGPKIINCFIDTGCSKALIGKNLVKDSEMLNKQIMT